MNILSVQWFSVLMGLAASVLFWRAAIWRPFYFPRVALLPLSMILLLGLQLRLGLFAYWQQHVLAGLYLLWAMLMVLLGATLKREFDLTRIIPKLMWLLLMVGIFQAVLVAINYFALTPVSHNTQLAQSAESANYFAIALAAVLYLLTSKRLDIVPAAVMAGALLFTLVLISPQLGWLYLGVLLVSARYLCKAQLLSTVHAFWLVPVFLAGQWLITQTEVSLITAKSEDLATVTLYWQLTQEAWQLFLAHPLLGVGWGQFGWHDFILAEAYPAHTGWQSHPYNLIVQLLAETGVIGAGIFMVSIFLWAKKVMQDKHVFEQENGAEYICLWVLFSLVSVEAIFKNGLNDTYILGLFGLLLGLLEVRIVKVHANAKFGIVSAVMVLSFGALVLFSLNAQYQKLQYWYVQNSFLGVASDQKELMLAQMGTLRHQSLFMPYIDLAIVRTLPNQPDFLADKLSLNTQLIQAKPSGREVYNQAELLARNGKAPEAMQQLKLALIRHPNDLYDFTMQLLKTKNKQTLPLLLTIAQHNRAYLEAQKMRINKKIPKSSGKTPSKMRDNLIMDI